MKLIRIAALIVLGLAFAYLFSDGCDPLCQLSDCARHALGGGD